VLVRYVIRMKSCRH